MYSRNFYPELEEKPRLPENYDGTAFSDNSHETKEEAECSEIAENTHSDNIQASGDGLFSFLGRVPFLSGFFGNGHGAIKFPKIGGEEILILAAAALMFFSKEGDKECALILLFLLFIS